MHISTVLTAVVAAAPVVVAHGGVPGAPKIFGMGKPLKGRDMGLAARRAGAPPHGHKVNKRQGGVDGQCGAAAKGAKCDAGYCCSIEGWCGKGNDYCAAPDCQIDFGTGCDALSIPNGESTVNVPRPQLGSVEYGGEGIYPCVVPGTVAITYDDGPYIYTNDVLDQFKKYDMKATFFITGINIGKGAIDDASTPWPAVITRMNAEGHQIASHTWSHQDLSAITHQQRVDQMVHNEMALRNILQKFPTYMRPPYSSCTAASGCEKDLKDLGYVVTYFDLDTSDYLHTVPEEIQIAKDIFSNRITPSNPATDKFLEIGHDIHQQTAQNLTGFMLEMLKTKGYKGVTVGECLGDPEANWYRASSGKTVTSTKSSGTQPSSTSSAGPTVSPTGISQDATCGATVKLTCAGSAFGNCCSAAGWCGSTADYCSTGCQSGFGNCGDNANTGSSSSAAAGSSSAASSASSAVSSSVAPGATPTGTPTKDGSCGADHNGATCIGWSEGECCSQYGYCGKTDGHCLPASGCNPLFGTCSGGSSAPAPNPSSSAPVAPTVITSTGGAPPTTVVPVPSSTRVPTTTTAAPPAPTQKVSTNGRCGPRNGGMTCKGYKGGWFGKAAECCGLAGICGSDALSCGKWIGCQSGYGNCS